MTDRVLGNGLRITVLQGRDAIRDRFSEQPPTPISLPAAASPNAAAAWHFQRLVFDCDLLVVATNNAGLYLGVLAGVERRTIREPFLILETSIVTDDAFGAALQRRLMAALLLRLVGLEDVPAALVARSHQSALCDSLRWFAVRHPAAILYPAQNSVVVSMRTGGMAVRISRKTGIPLHGVSNFGGAASGMVMLDLRGGDETSLVDTARQLYRSRLPRRIVAVDPTQPQRPQQGPGRTGTN